MKFKFLGTPDQPDEITFRDVVFPVGVPVEVTDVDFIRKLSRLPYFADDIDDAEVVKKRGRTRKVKNDQDGE